MNMPNKRKVVVAVAPVGANVHAPSCNPVTPEEVARETIACAEAGAAMVHLHVRDTKGNQTGNISDFARTLDLIREQSNIVIQGSTGGVCDLSLEERCVALDDSRVEVASLNMGSANVGEGVYINTIPDIRYWAKRMREAKVVPELELFEAGMISSVYALAEEGVLTGPHHFNFCLGFHGALPASAENLAFLKSTIAPGASWGFIHEGRDNFSLLATAVGLGASVVRVGFEDGTYLDPDCPAKTNSELVEKLVDVVKIMGYEVATASDARTMFGTMT
jgi:3-keto-5-aminohexanoate cleavage enzyme